MLANCSVWTYTLVNIDSQQIFSDLVAYVKSRPNNNYFTVCE